jgi:hypothetical protein
MLKEIKTHEADKTGKACKRCKLKFPYRKTPWKEGTEVGVIQGNFIESIAYKIGLNDSNQKCS